VVLLNEANISKKTDSGILLPVFSERQKLGIQFFFTFAVNL